MESTLLGKVLLKDPIADEDEIPLLQSKQDVEKGQTPSAILKKRPSIKTRNSLDAEQSKHSLPFGLKEEQCMRENFNKKGSLRLPPNQIIL